MAGGVGDLREGWSRGGLSGVVFKRRVADPAGRNYRLVVKRRGLPVFLGIPDALAGSFLFVVHKLRGQGYEVGISRDPPAQAGSWRRVRPLPAEKTVIVGPFATVTDALAEANAIAPLVATGQYADAP